LGSNTFGSMASLLKDRLTRFGLKAECYFGGIGMNLDTRR
jgi:hypothetical protein